MKKIFAIALVGLFTVALTENATAFDSDNDNIVLTVGEYDAPVEAIAFEIVPVTTDFVFYVTESVNYTSVGDFGHAVNTDSLDSFNYATNSTAFADVPIDYGIRSTNEYELTEPIYNLTEYVKNYNSTFGSDEPNFYRTIATNVGKLTYNI